jgi:hypothetical protein
MKILRESANYTPILKYLDEAKGSTPETVKILWGDIVFTVDFMFHFKYSWVYGFEKIDVEPPTIQFILKSDKTEHTTEELDSLRKFIAKHYAS